MDCHASRIMHIPRTILIVLVIILSTAIGTTSSAGGLTLGRHPVGDHEAEILNRTNRSDEVIRSQRLCRDREDLPTFPPVTDQVAEFRAGTNRLDERPQELPLDVRSELGQWRTEYVLYFCENYLGMSSSYLEECKQHGDYGLDTKYRHVMASFDKNPQSFVVKNSDRLPEVYRKAISSGTAIPRLTREDANRLIESFKGSDWRAIATNHFDVEITEQDEKSATRILRPQQIIAFLTEWMRQSGLPKEVALQELRKRVQAYLRRKEAREIYYAMSPSRNLVAASSSFSSGIQS